MNPTRMMGLYLRTWRRDWAGLSRAQLALAVVAGCGVRWGLPLGRGPPPLMPRCASICRRSPDSASRAVRAFENIVTRFGNTQAPAPRKTATRSPAAARTQG